jgi:hypothetical protein
VLSARKLPDAFRLFVMKRKPSQQVKEAETINAHVMGEMRDRYSNGH